MIRDKNTNRGDFIFYSNRIIRLLVEEGLNHLPCVEHSVVTPTGTFIFPYTKVNSDISVNCHAMAPAICILTIGASYAGVRFEGKICGVSIMRAGEAMEQGLRDCCRSVRIGKILIQRDEETCKPKLFYDKLPGDIADRYVLLLDPMFATGGSAMMAVEVLMSRGVPEDRILFLNLIASPEGIAAFAEKYSKVRVVTAFIDKGLDAKRYHSPSSSQNFAFFFFVNMVCIATSYLAWETLGTGSIVYNATSYSCVVGLTVTVNISVGWRIYQFLWMRTVKIKLTALGYAHCYSVVEFKGNLPSTQT